MNQTGHERLTGISTLAAVAGFVVVAHLAVAVAGGSTAFSGGFFDGDSFMRVMRVARLLDTGAWFDSVFHRANAPFGFETHWTRPFDLLMVVLAAPLMPFLGVAGAVHAAGVVVSPLLHGAMAAALVWAVTPLLGRIGAVVAAMVSVAQLGIMKLTAFGVADHHAAFLLLTVLTLGFMIRALGGTGGAFAAGVAAALGLWVGPEMLLFVALCLGVLGLAWVAGDGAGARRNTRFALGLALGTAAALLIERGGGLATVEYDRISLVHLTLAVLLLGVWRAVSAIERMRPVGVVARLALGMAAAATVAVVMLLLYPKFLHGPEADIDAALFPVLDTIHEYWPLGDLANLLGYVGTALFAFPMLAWRLWAERRGPKAWAWGLIAAGACVYVGLAIDWIRWAPYAGIFLSVALADLMVMVDLALTARMAMAARVPAKILVFLSIVLGPLVAGGLLAEEHKITGPACPLPALTRHLAGEDSRTILAAANFGPRILYETGHRVIATVHHRNEDGLLDSIRLLRAAEDAEALRRVRRRGIDWILLCPGYTGNHYTRDGDGDGHFYRRLEKGVLPAWLAEVPLPEPLAERFRLFAVSLPRGAAIPALPPSTGGNP
jgi:hypothetical protein